MEVILLERIEKLGQMGDIVNVKPGYARNYLLPQSKALRATEDNKSRFETERTHLEADNLERREEAKAVGDKMDGLSVVLVRQAGDAGQLYGSVSARDIADAIIKSGYTITRGQIALDRPIKAIGVHPVHVTLHPEVTVTVTTNVARSQEEADIQARTGEAIKSADELQNIADAEAAAAVEVAAQEAIAKADAAAAEAAEDIFEEGAAPEFTEESSEEELSKEETVAEESDGEEDKTKG